MRIIGGFIALLALTVFATAASADTLVLKNGDRLTGMVETSDGKNLTLKTDYAGEIKVEWAAVKEIISEKPLYVVTPDKKTVNGSVTTDGADLVVHTASAEPVRIPLTSVTTLRDADQEAAYEKTLHPNLLENWKGGASIGFALARGNSETTNLNTGFTGDRKTLSDHIALYLNSIYASNNKTGGGVTANDILAGARFDKNLTKRYFAFVSGDFVHDELEELNVRGIYSGGLGVHVIDTGRTTFDFLAGANYTRETYSVGPTGIPPVGGLVRNLAGITVGEDFTRKLGKASVFTEKFYFYPDLSNTGQYRFALDAGLVSKISNWLGWQFTVSDRYVSNPPVVGTVANDVVFSTGLNFTFNH
jgi:putative salt-induced outer membrane protein